MMPLKVIIINREIELNIYFLLCAINRFSNPEGFPNWKMLLLHFDTCLCHKLVVKQLITFNSPAVGEML